MYKTQKIPRTGIETKATETGESLEQILERMIANKEPIEGKDTLIYTEKKDGIHAGYNIRTDRFEVALDAIDSTQRKNRATKNYLADQKIKQEQKTKEALEKAENQKQE